MKIHLRKKGPKIFGPFLFNVFKLDYSNPASL
jgi:hypothetical protein